MRSRIITCLLVCIGAASFLALSNAQDSGATHNHGSEANRLVIVPLVKVKPGESKEILFSTSCTVGATRGGGFSLAEMKHGRPQFEQAGLKGSRVFNKNGVTISVPDFQEGPEFASREEFATLKQLGVNAFQVTISASDQAEPGLLEMHLLDATCSGRCKTDFRVLVVAE